MKIRETFNNKRYKLIHLESQDMRRVKTLVEMVGFGKKVLDVGCGDGEIGARLLSKGNEVYGLDISESCVIRAKDRGIRAEVIDLEEGNFPFKDHFDVVLAGEILEHVFDTKSFLGKIHKSLKDKGELVLSTPNLASFGRRLLLLVGKNPLIEASLENGAAGHVRYFIKDTLLALLENNGFKVIEFKSDLVNFNASGSVRSDHIADLFPTLGKCLIVKCTKL